MSILNDIGRRAKEFTKLGASAENDTDRAYACVNCGAGFDADHAWCPSCDTDGVTELK